MHVFLGHPPAAICPAFLNVDKRVDQSGTAAVEDVLLVQFALHKIGEKIGALPAFWGPIFLKVPVNGKVDSNTVEAIKTFQRGRPDNPRGTNTNVVDGMVSRAHGYVYGQGDWTIYDLNVQLAIRFPEVYPRIDNIPGCPGALSKAVRKAFLGGLEH